MKQEEEDVKLYTTDLNQLPDFGTDCLGGNDKVQVEKKLGKNVNNYTELKKT